MTAPDTVDGLAAALELEEEGRTALQQHAAAVGAAARQRLGGFDAARLDALLADGQAVRFPTRLCFDEGPLQPGEFAVALPVGDAAADGFVVFVHPYFRDRVDALPYLVPYHLVSVNYGETATPEAAEAFGAALLGIPVDAYYAGVSAFADELAVMGRLGMLGTDVCGSSCGGSCGC